MTEERVLNEAQIDLGMALPLQQRDVLKMFFVLLSRGTQVAEAIDLLAEIHNIKAPTQPSGYGSFEPGSSGPGSPEWGEHVLPERECKGCGVTFRPRFGVQTYHDVPCRTAATVRRRLEHTVRWQGRR